jgi:hypothetical protein
MSGNQGVQRAILIGWMLLGWAALILLADHTGASLLCKTWPLGVALQLNAGRHP